MILADKIIEERKRNGWSQEELAEQLGVSRQSVSKWEGAQSIPDINKILMMADVFGVSTDYLLKDEIENKDNELISESVEDYAKDIRKVSMEDAVEYMEIRKKNAPLMALGTALCIVSPIPLIVLSGFAESDMFGISEQIGGAVGMTLLFLLIAIGTFFFLKCGSREKKYEFLETELIDTAYGVNGLVKEKKEAFMAKYNLFVTVGVILCIVAVLPLLISSFLSEQDYVYICMVGVLLAMIAIAVYLFVSVGVVKGSYDKLLQEEDYTAESKRAQRKKEWIGRIYWLLATAVFLVWMFISGSWHQAWIVWPVAGVLYPVLLGLADAIDKRNKY